eukprot:COSAG03_NODE_6704_length_1018_cov_0.710555_1_plen_334_part_10
MDKVVGRRQRGGEWQYKVRWEGYGPSDDTWEPIDNLLSCIGKVRQYIETADAQVEKKHQDQEQPSRSNDELLALQLQRKLSGMRVQPDAKQFWQNEGVSLLESDQSTASEAEPETEPITRGSRTRRSQTRHMSQTQSSKGDATNQAPHAQAAPKGPVARDDLSPLENRGGAANAQRRRPSVSRQAQMPGNLSAAKRSAGSGQKQGRRACSNCGRALLPLGLRCICYGKKSADGTLRKRAPVRPAAGDTSGRPPAPVRPRSGATPADAPGQEPAQDAASSYELESNEDAAPARKRRTSARVAASVSAEEQLQQQKRLKAAEEHKQQGARTKRRQG